MAAASPATAGEHLRLFVALELPSEARSALHAWQEAVLTPIRALRVLPSESLHVTLCFLGLRPASEVDAIARACDVLATAPAPQLMLAEPLWLPPRRPQVLAVAISEPRGDGALAGAQAAVARALEAIGAYARERRPFLGHVTVARVRRGSPAPRGGSLEPPPDLPFAGARATLFRSLLGDGPARYEPLHSVALEPS